MQITDPFITFTCSPSTKVQILTPEARRVAAHLAIATRLCDSIIAAPSHASVKVWAKLLLQVRVDNSVDLEQLCVLVKHAQAAASGWKAFKPRMSMRVFAEVT